MPTPHPDTDVLARGPRGSRSSSPSLFIVPPLVSVAVRSLGRLPQLLELLDALQQQDHPSFEIVVIEQSSAEQRHAHRHELARFMRDRRVRILFHPPLGAGRARIEAARAARGALIAFMDDDDLPLGSHWLSTLVANFDDPRCMAVSGRQVLDPMECARPAQSSARDRRLCLRYSFLCMPRGRMRQGARVEGVTQVAGGNAAIRRSAIERAGGWDPEDDHDEDSFAFRFARVKQRDEYFAFDPQAVMLRRLDVPGGLGRRRQTATQRLRAELRYSHRVVRKYHPARFYGLYPVYLALAVLRALHHVREAHPDSSYFSHLADLLRDGPRSYVAELTALLSREHP